MPEQKDKLDSIAFAIGRYVTSIVNVLFMVSIIHTVTNPWLIGYAAFELCCTFLLVSLSWFRDKLQ